MKITKQAIQVLRSLKEDVNKVKCAVKKKMNGHRGIILSSPSVNLHDLLPRFLTEEKFMDGCCSNERDMAKCLNIHMQEIDGDVNNKSMIGPVEEINKLAEAFIQNFHQKMRLEKQDSYRSYQEMLERGI
ncbi:hypothetical protein SUGI_0317230 [Cryptomeria japonica]|nr:hypothetical protein SUGI_0317230 [Cryptomeria japonica]